MKGKLTPKVLHLTLHCKWFDEILSGRKKEEYRNHSVYWRNRIVGKHFDEIRFINGYGKHRPYMRVELKGVTYIFRRIVLHLGKILEVGNVK